MAPRQSLSDHIAGSPGMIRIARYRFRAFEVKFHRAPGPDEPLFFDESKGIPVRGEPAIVQLQLEEAAIASGTELGPVLKLLGLAPMTSGGTRAAGGIRRLAKSSRLLKRPNRSSRVRLRQSTVWKTFLADHRLRQRYAVSSEELDLLSRVLFLGRARTIEDCLRILKLIREATS